MTESERIKYTRALIDPPNYMVVRKDRDSTAIYELGSAEAKVKPDQLSYETFSGVDCNLYCDGELQHWCQGLSFTGFIDAIDRENNIVQYSDVVMTITFVMDNKHMPPEPNGNYLLLGVTEIGNKFKIGFDGFKKMMAGVGISIDDITTGINYVFTGGKATIQTGIPCEIKEKKDSDDDTEIIDTREAEELPECFGSVVALSDINIKCKECAHYADCGEKVSDKQKEANQK